jgi:hypothetical protein
MVFFNFWAGRAMKTILAPKFGGPAQRWDRAGLGKGGAGWNPRPPFPPLIPPPLLPRFFLLFPLAFGGGGRGGGGKWGEEEGLGGGGAWIGSMHHPLPWLPPQSPSKIGSF